MPPSLKIFDVKVGDLITYSDWRHSENKYGPFKIEGIDINTAIIIFFISEILQKEIGGRKISKDDCDRFTIDYKNINLYGFRSDIQYVEKYRHCLICHR